MHYIQLLINVAPTYSTLIYEHILPLGLLGRDFATQSKHIFVLLLENSIYIYIYTHTYTHTYIFIHTPVEETFSNHSSQGQVYVRKFW